MVLLLEWVGFYLRRCSHLAIRDVFLAASQWNTSKGRSHLSQELFANFSTHLKLKSVWDNFKSNVNLEILTKYILCVNIFRFNIGKKSLVYTFENITNIIIKGKIHIILFFYFHYLTSLFFLISIEIKSDLEEKVKFFQYLVRSPEILQMAS